MTPDEADSQHSYTAGVSRLRIVDVVDAATFDAIPPCADLRFDHRTCDAWEDADRGAKLHRPAMLSAAAPPPRPQPSPAGNPFLADRQESNNPLTPSGRNAALQALAVGDDDDAADFNPFAPTTHRVRPMTYGVPRKLALLDRGRGVFGSYAKVAYLGDESVAYAQFGPLSAYPRALRLRELYPKLPASPLPAVITCVATTSGARGMGHALELIADVCGDLAERGFSAVEAYPDLTRPVLESSASRPGFWLRCGFTLAVDDERFPVMRRDLD